MGVTVFASLLYDISNVIQGFVTRCMKKVFEVRIAGISSKLLTDIPDNSNDEKFDDGMLTCSCLPLSSMFILRVTIHYNYRNISHVAACVLNRSELAFCWRCQVF